jgi:adenosine deaminase
MHFNDLHRHLDGSLRDTTVYELAKECEVRLPNNLSSKKFCPGMSLAKALSCFELTLKLLQKPHQVKRVAGEICEDAINEGITDLEIRFAPQLHLGADINNIVDSVIEGVNNRAGIILCGLYGEDPKVLEQLLISAENKKEVVGLDLAGAPLPTNKFQINNYKDVFKSAKSFGLGVTIHAGEGRNVSEIHYAIEELGADRIGHGTSLLDSKETVNLVKSKGITIEACITSNIHTNVINKFCDHPILDWIENDILVCLCTDNTFFSQTDISNEFKLLKDNFSISENQLNILVQNGQKAKFKRL